ncbi:hypothetical protein EBU95_20815, partial [bacterium]|nr:hypothetical protein [bacterium]
MFKVDAFSEDNFNTLYVTDFEEVFFEVYQVRFNDQEFVLEGKMVNGLPIVEIQVEGQGAVEAVLKKGQPRLILSNGSKQVFEEKKSNILFVDEKPSIVPVFEIKDDKPIVRPRITVEMHTPEQHEVVVEKEVVKEVKIAESEVLEYIDKKIDGIKTRVTQTLSEAEYINENTQIQLDNYQSRDESLEYRLDKLVENTNKIIDENTQRIEQNVTEFITEKNNKTILTVEASLDEFYKQLNVTKDLTEVYQNKVIALDSTIQQIEHLVTDNHNEVLLTVETNLDILLNQLNDVKEFNDTYQHKVVTLENTVDLQRNNFEQNIIEVKSELATYSTQLSELAAKVADNKDLISDTEHKLISQIDEKIQILEATFRQLVLEQASNTTIVEKTIEGDTTIISEKAEVKRKDIDNINTQIAYIKRVLGTVGGGSVAVQYANGGTMNGNLNVNGKILSGGIDISTLFGTGSGGGGVTGTGTVDYIPKWTSTNT